MNEVLAKNSVLNNRYTITDIVGQGGMGTVYSAVDGETDSAVAVKVLHTQLKGDESIVRRFFREAKAATTISHPNIIKVFDAGVSEDEEPYLVMELLEGESLASLIDRVGTMGLPAACGILEPVLLALSAAHDKSIIHRDLKPENIFIALEPDGAKTVKLIDFGISKFVDIQKTSQQTAAGSVLGTPVFMSPEQLLGDQSLDHRADIYSIGVILYLMITGHPPFHADQFSQLVAQVLTSIPPPPSEESGMYPSFADQLVLAALDKDPEQRPQSALEMLEKLRATSAFAERRERLDALTQSGSVITYAGGNLGKPVGDSDGDNESPSSVFEGMSTPPPRTPRGKTLLIRTLVALGSLVAVAGLSALIIYANYFQLPALDETPGTIEVPAELTRGPSIVVEPFSNLKSASQTSYLADGLTESVIDGLSRHPKLLVLDRHTSYAAKGKFSNPQQVGEELGVQFLVKGVVNQSADRLKVTTELIDTATGQQLWTSDFNEAPDNYSTLQNAIVDALMDRLEIAPLSQDGDQTGSQSIDSLSGYLKFLKAKKYYRMQHQASNLKARLMAEEVIEVSPDFSAAHRLLAMTYVFELWYGPHSPTITKALATRYAKNALDTNPDNSDAYITLAILLLREQRFEEALLASKKSVVLHPGSADAYLNLAFVLYKSNRMEEALEMAQLALRLNPLPPCEFHHLLGHIYLALEQYDLAAESYHLALKANPDDLLAHVGLTILYSQTQRPAEAQKALRNIKRIQPDYSLDVLETSANKNRDLHDMHAKALLEAGLR